MNSRGELGIFYGHCVNNKLLLRLQQQRTRNGQTGVSSNDVTHYLMDGRGGGNLVVRNDQHSDFLEAYAKGLANGEVTFLVEKRTPLFRWHADLDFKGPRAVPRDKIILICKHVQEIVRRFYPSVSGMTSENCFFDLVVMETNVSTPAPPSAAGSSTAVKTGLHLVMPNLPVTTDECKNMRMSIMADLEEQHGDMAGWNPWEDIVDLRVYEGNGLRAPGSHKAAKCPNCKGDSLGRKSCGKCNMKGFLNVGRVYSPTIYLTQSGECSDSKLKRLTEGYSHMASLLTIRFPTPPPKPEWKLPPLAPIFPSHTNTRIPAGQHSEDYKSENVRYRTANRGPNLPSHSEEVRQMARFLQRCINKKLYGRIQVKSMYTYKNGYIVNVKGHGSHSCMNMRGEKKQHKSNTIYFQVTQTGVYQRCYCGCTGDDVLAKRKHGLCKEYKSEPYQLTPQLAHRLFPDRTNVNPSIGISACVSFSNNPDLYIQQLAESLDKNRTVLFPGSPAAPSTPKTSNRSRMHNK